MFDIKIDEKIALLSMQHGKVNAMNLEFCLELVEHFQRLENSPNCNALVITGVKTVFSAGVDLIRLIEEDVSYLDRFLPALNELFRIAFAFSKPLVGWINGHAIAGGCVLACACDYRIVHPKAKIGIPELRVGVPFPTLGLEIMRFTAGTQSFRQIVNNGKTFEATEAIAAGLADELSEDSMIQEQAMKTAGDLAAIPPRVFAHNKKHVRNVAWERIESGEREFEPEVQAIWRTPEVRENIKLYVDRKLKKLAT